MNNAQVVKNWDAGIKGKAGSLSTDVNNLFSYRMLIGITTTKGNHFAPAINKILADATTKGGKFVSVTTSRHVGLARENTTASVANWSDFLIMLADNAESIFGID